jgi:hypothetical protein
MRDFNRRDAARAAMLGGASFLLSQSNLQAQSSTAQSGLLNAHNFGAVATVKPTTHWLSRGRLIQQRL